MTTTALSVHQPYADLILSGAKTVEYRSWYTHHRGPLLICATQRPCVGHAIGIAICIVDLVECNMDADGDFEWILENPRPVPGFGVKGRQKLYQVGLPADLHL